MFLACVMETYIELHGKDILVEIFDTDIWKSLQVLNFFFQFCFALAFLFYIY